MPRRILITTSTYPRWPGDSTTTFVAEFARRLTGKGDTVTVLAPHTQGANITESDGPVSVRRYRYFWPANAETIAGDGNAVRHIVRTPLYAVKLMFLLLSLFLHTAWLATAKRSDIINGHWIIPQGFLAVLAGKLSGKKVVVTVHGSDIFGLNSRLLRRIKAYTLKAAYAVVVNSSSTLQACRELYERPDYQLIPMGVDVDRFKPADPPAALRRRLHLGPFTVLYVGRLSEQKGVTYLLGAIRQLHAAHISCRLLVIGDGPERTALEGEVQAGGLGSAVTFLGWIDASQLPGYYNLADVFVGPSITANGRWKEAFGLVFAEAQACGVPVIATKTGGIGDVVADGVTGILVAEQSADAISAALRQLHDNPKMRRQLAVNARARAVAAFSWEQTIERYRQLFEDVT